MPSLKEGFPEEDAIVMCTITAIHYHSVFAKLDEYTNKSGMIHISEISPGRIRNIRDYVKEGKKVVCKVLRVNMEKGYIDLSLRRVGEMQKKQKVNELKQEQISEKLVNYIAKQKKQDLAKFYKDIKEKITAKYESVFSAFEDVAADALNLERLGIDKDIAKQLTEVIKQRIKPPEVEIKGVFNISSHKPDGINIIKDAVKKAEEVKGDFKISYKGGGLYSLNVKAGEYKTAEKVLKKVTETLITTIESNGSEAEFIRAE